MKHFEEVEYTDYSKYEIGELAEVISIMEDEAPKDRRGKPYKAWVEDINKLFEIYNIKAGFKAYNKIK